MDQFQTVGYSKCIVKHVHIKSFEGQKGGLSEPLELSGSFRGGGGGGGGGGALALP